VITEKTEADAYFAVGEMIRSLGIWVTIGLIAAALGALLFAFRISRPILKIGVAATEVGEGNFKARVVGVTSRDEIGDLAQRINTMIVHINERFQLAKFVSGETIDAIRRSDEEGVKLGGLVDTNAQLEAAVRQLNGLATPPDVVLVTGDLVEDGPEVPGTFRRRPAGEVLVHRLEEVFEVRRGRR